MSWREKSKQQPAKSLVGSPAISKLNAAGRGRSRETTAYGKARVKGLEATMISTAGDTDRWEARVQVSNPHSSTEILNLMRERIAANTARGGMFKPVPHIKGAVNVSPASANDSRIKWKFTDDLGRGWDGSGMVEPAPDDKGKFILTLSIAREKA